MRERYSRLRHSAPVCTIHYRDRLVVGMGHWSPATAHLCIYDLQFFSHDRCPVGISESLAILVIRKCEFEACNIGRPLMPSALKFDRLIKTGLVRRWSPQRIES